MAAISGECFTTCGRARGYHDGPNPDCQQPPGACQCLCHEPPGGPR